MQTLALRHEELRMTAKLDLVLVNPSSRKLVYQDLATELAAVEPPVWAGLIASYARGKGLSVAIVDAEAEGLSAEAAAAQVADLDSRLVAVVVYGHQPSASTQNMPAASAFTTALKERAPEQPILLVGGHVAALPQRTLEEEMADFVCDGEGPVTVVDLVAALRDEATSRRCAVFGFVPPAFLVTASPRRSSAISTERCPASRGTFCRCRSTARTTGTASEA